MTRATALATFYAFVGLVFGGLAIYVRGEVWTHPDPWFSLSPWGAHAYSILLGFTVGLLGVGATFALVKKTHWAKLLHDELRPSVSGMPWPGIIAVALFSSLGEEILFRSVLQTSTNLWIQALVFGLAHQLPGRSRWTWVLWATIMGLVFGVLFEATGSCGSDRGARDHQRHESSFPPSPSDPTRSPYRGWHFRTPHRIMTSVTTIPPEQPRVLIVDDERFIRDILADFLTMEGYAVRTADDGTQAVNELSRSNFALVISDLKMPKMGGLELLQHVSRLQPEALTVIMTGFGTVETAIDAMKHGAYDYILKPFKVEEIVHVVQRGLEKQRLAAENLRLREALSLYKVSEAITASLSLEDVVATIEESAFDELAADGVAIWLDDGEGNFFERVRKMASPRDHGRGPVSFTDPGALDCAAMKSRILDEISLLIHGPDCLPLFQSQPRKPVVSTLTVPLKMRERLLGWITLSSLTLGKRFTEGQRKLLTIIASRAAAAIENARLYEDLQQTFQQTIQSLANTIDKMDRYTAGHSQRVATYAVRLARWMGLGERDIEVVRQAALMHDIGKIGCVMNLNKPGKLTSTEYDTFQKHPTYGKEILDPIQFLGPVIPGVHLHHERWDGNGYPLRLSGNNIPLIARIISVADTYDAMTSDRAYRKALPHEVTVGEIERCSGTQFDPEIAANFTEQIERFREEQLAAGEAIPE